jgi:hypothetical protein
MAHSGDTQFSATQLLWVGVIALVPGLLITWFRTESIALTLFMATLSAVISVAVVWFIGWTRRAR